MSEATGAGSGARGAARETERVCVVAFGSTHDAMEAESICREAHLAGRIIPLPVQIHAECGMAWRMPLGERLAFERAMAGKVEPQGFYELEL